MGYESKIYVVEKSSLSPDENGKRFAEVISVFNGSKFGGLSEIFKQKTDCYIYADNGNTRIFKDKYGDELTETPLSDVIAFLEKEIENGENYRRISPLLGLLRSCLWKMHQSQM